MGTIRYLVAGDRGITDDIEYQGVLDLVGVSNIVAHVWKTVGAPDRHELAVDIVDAEARIIRVRYGDGPGDWLPSLTVQAAWKMDVAADWPEAAPVTSPRRVPVTLKVRARGATSAP